MQPEKKDDDAQKSSDVPIQISIDTVSDRLASRWSQYLWQQLLHKIEKADQRPVKHNDSGALRKNKNL